ncbi:hypothetical protein BdWA1_000062 [Babesia duncani]|uniref:Uncharacterized protein n=1 Tax=Babesia duncani TaxID=323732 RepID=A0AAD9UPN4_9APIC|nr:hypothetical protein BdWA1_000062 [Babesia duncani]
MWHGDSRVEFSLKKMGQEDNSTESRPKGDGQRANSSGKRKRRKVKNSNPSAPISQFWSKGQNTAMMPPMMMFPPTFPVPDHLKSVMMPPDVAKNLKVAMPSNVAASGAKKSRGEIEAARALERELEREIYSRLAQKQEVTRINIAQATNYKYIQERLDIHLRAPSIPSGVLERLDALLSK